MTETEKKALALVNEEAGSTSWTMTHLSHPYNRILFQALCRAIEQHEAFRQEVSDAVERMLAEVFVPNPWMHKMRRFIIAKPDPLVEALNEAFPVWASDAPMCLGDADNLRAALATRGLEIREVK